MKELKKEFYGRLISFISKKFALASFIVVASTVMVFQGHINGMQWLTVMAVDILGYDFANALTKKYK